jgi:hypothetical protein
VTDGEEYRQFERTLTNATAQHTGAALDMALDDLGWHDALAADPRTAISLLCELQGAANATSCALGYVFAHALGMATNRGNGIVLPPIGRWDPPGTVDGGDLAVQGIANASLAHEGSALIVTTTGARTVAVSVPTESLALQLVDGMDPDLMWYDARGTSVLADRNVETLAGDWASAVALGRLAVAHELVGTSRAMLELACAHARSRIQFGRTIGSFQAVRHRLAETLVGIETADAMLEAAWLDRLPKTAAMAKSVAGRQARTTARHCQQVLAGIGFTTEHPLHRYIRRSFVLDALLGSTISLTRALGTEVIMTSELPALPLL